MKCPRISWLSSPQFPCPVQPADVPVILCRNFLNYHEKEKLLTVVRDSEVNSGYEPILGRCSQRSLLFTDMEFDSRRSAVAFLCGKLREQGYVGPGFLESVMQRESIAPTAFEPGFAFAHAMENNAKRTAVCVCVLKNKLPWGEHTMSRSSFFLPWRQPGTISLFPSIM